MTAKRQIGDIAIPERDPAPHGADAAARLQEAEPRLGQMEARLRVVTRARKLLTQCTRLLVRAADEQELLQEMCRIVVLTGGYRTAWIGLTRNDAAQPIETVASAGADRDFLHTFNVAWDDDYLGADPTAAAVHARTPRIARWRDPSSVHDHLAVAALPLIREGEVLGVLSVASAEADAFDAGEVGLLDELAHDIAYGMFNLRLRAGERDAKGQIEESERRFRTTFDVVQVGINHITADGRILAANPRMEQMLGYGPGELVGRNIKELALPEDDAFGEELWQQRERLHRGEIPRIVTERRYRHKDGSTVHVSIVIAVLRDAAGNAQYDISAMEDITARKRAEDLHRLEHSVVRSLANADSVAAGLKAVMRAVCEAQSWECARYFRADEAAGTLRFEESWCVRDAAIERFIAESHGTVLRKGSGLAGQAWRSGAPMWTADAGADLRVQASAAARDAGLHGVFALPVIAGGATHGVLAFASKRVRKPDERLLQSAYVISSQVGQFLQRRGVEEEMRRFREAIDSSPDIMLLVDRATLRYIDVNQTMCRLLGYTREELLQMGPADLLPFSSTEFAQIYDELIANPSAHGGNLRSFFRCKDGSELPIEYTRKVLPTGSTHIIIVVARDIRERVAAEHALHESNDRFRSLTALSSDVYWEQDDQFRFTTFTQRGWTKGLSGRQALLIGKRRWDYPYLNMTQADWAAHIAVLEAHQPFRDLELCAHNDAGGHVWTSTSGEPVFDQAGVFKGYRGIGKDVTARKRDEDELRRFRLALDNSADMIVLIDRTTMRFVDVNTTVCRLLGYSREELLAMGPQDITPVSRAQLEQAYDRFIANPDRIEGMHSYYRCKDGSILPFESTRRVLRSGDSYIIAAISRDIRERIAADQALRESNERFNLVSRATSDVIWDWNIGTGHLWWNENFTEVFGDPLESTARDVSSWYDRVHPDDCGRVDVGIQQVIASGAARWSDEYRFRRADGTYAHVFDRGHVIRDEAGKAVRMIGAMVDITERKRTEETIRSQSVQRRLTAEFGQQALASADLRETLSRAVDLITAALRADYCDVVELDAETQQLTYRAAAGWPAEWASQRVTPLEPGSQAEYVLSRREPLILEDHATEQRFTPSPVAELGVRSGVHVPILGAHRTFGMLSVHSRELRRFTEDEVSFLQSMANILAVAIDRKKAEDRMAHLAQFDNVTGLPNRYLTHDRLSQTLAAAERNHAEIGVMFVDLDRFKAVNDTFGHALGDKLLSEVAVRLKNCVRASDIVGRLSGDEFAIVITNLVKADDAAVVAQKLIDAMAQPFELDGHHTYVSASIGIALYPGDGTDPDALIKNADTAMYRAKEQGRNGYQFFLPEMNARLVDRLRLESQLRGALVREEFLLHYQPKVRLDTGEISGFEALLRWKNGDKLVSPADFIPILEDTGLIVPVGEWVLHTVCAQLRQWERQGVTPRPIAVNLSARQFQSRGLAAMVERILVKTGVAPQLIELELTESLLMSDAEEAVQMLRELKRLGVRIAVDDFGTGYSSLAYLKRFPLDALKIDREFVRDAIGDADDATITLTIINLAHSLKLTVVAEGVETEEQLNFLRAHGCDEMQGYYFARPSEAAEATRLLADGCRLRRSPAGTRPDAPLLLLVDDCENDRELLERMLVAEGFRVLTADSAKSAFDILARDRVDIVVSDNGMPEMTGVEFLSGVKRLYPDTVRVMTSIDGDLDLLAAAINTAGIHRLLLKDWQPERLRAELRAAYQSRRTL